MAGVRQFDETEVIKAAMRLFWKQGYGPTTMANLAQATGLQRGSLYNAYGDKEALLLGALEYYAREQSGAVHEALAHPDLREAIKGFLDAHLARMAAPGNPAGCLMCQTALECASRDPGVSKPVRAHFLRTETALRDALEQGKRRGQLGAVADTTALARFFLGVSRGMAVLHRAYGDLAAVEDMARIAMRVLDQPPLAA